MLVLSLEMKSDREGGQVLGIATPFAPTPVPAWMLKTGTRDGSRLVGLLLLLLLLGGGLVLAGGLMPIVGEMFGVLLLFGWLMFCGGLTFVGGAPGRPLCLPGNASTLIHRRYMTVVVVRNCIVSEESL